MKSKIGIYFFLVSVYTGFLFLLLPFIYPTSLNPDRGIFESVSYRLISGDKLYLQVWDNKDPLFYYINSFFLYISPLADVLLEITIFISISVIIFLINKKHFIDIRINFMFSFIVSPLLIINFGYIAGYTHIPGILLVLFIYYLIYLQQERLIGIILGISIFTKIIFFPIAFMLILMNLNKTKFIQFIKNFFITCFIILILLFSRGELTPYLNSLFLNYSYSTSNLSQQKIIQILSINNGIFIGIIMLILLYINIKYKRQNRLNKLIKMNNILFFGSILMFIITGKFEHHIQIFIPSIMLILTILLISLNKYKFFSFLFTFILLFTLIYETKIYSVTNNFKKLIWYYDNDQSIPTESNLLLSIAPEGDYARLGQNDDNAHAKFLEKWKLACPRFHQYPFESNEILNRSLKCVINSKYLIVSPTFKEYQDLDNWNRFVKVGNNLINRHFSCTDYSGTRICINRSKE